MPKLLDRPEIQTIRTGNSTHKHSVCETCCRRVATDSNKLAFYLNEFSYIANQSICIVLEDSLKMIKFSLLKLKSLLKKKDSREHLDHVHVPGQLCARCVSARQRTNNEAVDTISEQLYMAAQAFSLIAMLFGGFVFGLATLCMSLFPGSNTSSPEQAEYEARRQAEDLRKKKQEDDDYWASYEADRQGLNDLVSEPLDISDHDMLEDHQRTTELNGALNAVVNGTESKETVLKMRDELYNHRMQLVQRDALRGQRHAAYMNKSREGDDLNARGDQERRQGNDAEAAKYYARADAAFRESDALYSDYRTT